MQDLNDRLLVVEKQLDRIESGIQRNRDCLHNIAQKLRILVESKDADESLVDRCSSCGEPRFLGVCIDCD